VEFDASGKSKGRVLGLEALWLTKGNNERADCCIDNKPLHNSLKAEFGKPAYFEERQKARKALWDLRLAQPNILRLFQLEARPPVGLLPLGSEPNLCEPRGVF
jgi:hypothetical protein